MILGLSLAAFTILQVLISLAAIAAGVVVVGMLRGERLSGWTNFFLAFTLLTSLTGFLFPINGFTPALGTGAVSVVILLVALWALYGGRLAGAWRWIFVVCAVAVLYFNVLVLIVQAFLKVPPLHVLAPTGSEPPFLVVQTVALAVAIVAGVFAVRRFRPGSVRAG